MEDGELPETFVEIDKRGEKRNQSVLEEDEEEILSIKPPPVANKKHKRHHKKHKVGKEEKKKKRHRDHHNRNDKDKYVTEWNKNDRENENSRKNYDIRDISPPLLRRTPSPIEITRRDGPGRPIDRSHRSLEFRTYSEERIKPYNYKSHDRDYTSGRVDSKYDAHRAPAHTSSSRSIPYRVPGDRIPPYHPKRDDKEYIDRNHYKPRRDDSFREPRSKNRILTRLYEDDDYDQRRESTIRREGGDRNEKGKHVRSVSSSIVVRSMPSSEISKQHRRSDNSSDHSYKRRSRGAIEAANGQKHLSNDRTQNRRQTPESAKTTKEIESNQQFNTEVVSSEDSSESSQSSEIESEEEEEEDTNGESRKNNPQHLKKYQEDEPTVQEDASSSEEDDEEEEDDTSSENPDPESDDSAMSEQNESGSAISEEEIESEHESNDKDVVDDTNEDDQESDMDDLPNYSDLGEEDLASPEHSPPVNKKPELPYYLPAIQGCRSVDEFQCLNRIEEGTYGVVYRAKDKRTNNIVALKRLKMEKEREGFPITSLREICTLLKANHRNCVRVQEIVVGSNVDKIYIVMDFVEHDLKHLMDGMKQPFLVGEVKTLLMQLLRGVHHLHDNWILHRDLKTSNILLSHGGILKIGDFGLAREYGSPLKPYTPIVVTLWYRSPELLLGAKEYSTAVDMWSVGCIFAEMLSKKPLFQGKSEIMQLQLIFKELGTPTEKIWPGYSELPIVKKTTFSKIPYNTLRKRFGATDISEKGFDLLNRFLTYCPDKRITAYKALQHEWFEETPKPVEPSMFPTWPAKSEQTKRKTDLTPKAPEGAMGYNAMLNEEEKLGFQLTAPRHGISKSGMGFSLKF